MNHSTNPSEHAAPVAPAAVAPSVLTDEGMIPRPDLARENLAVWYGPMPESNGKTNWTAILHNGDIASGMTLDRSEYPDRVRYEADRARWLIGELAEEPWILDYDADKHSGYVAPQQVAESAQEGVGDERASIWVLTFEVNDYNQHGDYFVAAWTQKPTAEQLRDHVKDWFCGPDINPARLLLETGGGRQGIEDLWYKLEEK